jgi:hypothetical protein
MPSSDFQTLPGWQPGILGVVASTRRVFARHTHAE